jgi:hypothetical protein
MMTRAPRSSTPASHCVSLSGVRWAEAIAISKGTSMAVSRSSPARMSFTSL